jgi:hypothetical protein
LRRYRPDCREIDLRRLSEADTRSLIQAVDASRALDADEVSRLVAQSGGVPLYAESLALVSTRADGVGRLGSPPRQITAVMEERLSFASPEDQRLLEEVSVSVRMLHPSARSLSASRRAVGRLSTSVRNSRCP